MNDQSQSADVIDIENIIDGSRIIPSRPKCASNFEISKHFGAPMNFETESNVVRGLIGAHKTVAEQWRNLCREHIDAADDDDWPAKRRKRVEEKAERITNEAQAAHDRAIEAAEKRLCEIEMTMDEGLVEDHSSIALSAEIRSVIRSMPDEQRAKFEIRGFADDPQLARAIANGPQMTTGLSVEAQGQARLDYFNQVYPDMMRERTDIIAASNRVRKAASAYLDHLHEWRANLTRTIPDIKAG